MTRKHFKALADMVALLFFIEGKGKAIETKDVEEHLKAILQAENPNFDTKKWNIYIIKTLATLVNNEKIRADRTIKALA